MAGSQTYLGPLLDAVEAVLTSVWGAHEFREGDTDLRVKVEDLPLTGIEVDDVDDNPAGIGGSELVPEQAYAFTIVHVIPKPTTGNDLRERERLINLAADALTAGADAFPFAGGTAYRPYIRNRNFDDRGDPQGDRIEVSFVFECRIASPHHDGLE